MRNSLNETNHHINAQQLQYSMVKYTFAAYSTVQYVNKAQLNVSLMLHDTKEHRWPHFALHSPVIALFYETITDTHEIAFVEV